MRCGSCSSAADGCWGCRSVPASGDTTSAPRRATARRFIEYALTDPRFGADLRALAAELLDGGA